MSFPYDDILGLPHRVSAKHPPMSAQDRAAQFSPFAALTGYEDAVRETGRLTERKVELNEEAKAVLDQKLQLLTERPEEQPPVVLTCFLPDEKKSGGSTVTVSGAIRRVDRAKRALLLTDGQEIPLDEIIEIDSELFRGIF